MAGSKYFRAAVDALNLLEAERHTELYVGCSIGIVGQFVVVVEAVVLCSEAESLMPLHARFLPAWEPLQFGAGLNEELHLHLLELAHTEDELAGYYLVAEGLANLRYAERNLHSAGLLHVEVVHEDALSRLGTQIHLHRTVGRGSHLGREHEVELAHVCPVACSADGAYYLLVEDYLLQCLEVGALHGGSIALVEGVTLLAQLLNARRRGQILLLVESLLEAFAGLVDLFLYLLVVLGNLVFNENIGAIALL